ncbi:hypothetical protein RCO27_10930 [Sphingosinicella sp. LHD-64]|uniref:hypothetical protein n=1 Tax=Sphingosinicella sp. LHD-64 TaxID=3072139 RepID=UPI00280F62A3|nr:hypothetical protein [Sphingosinicella sp. LHD-64]MDQ8756742.1 hypothetical protein [Sphingosinicella sp. LHD-64]
MTAVAARPGPAARLRRAGMVALALAGLAACGTAPVQPEPATGASLDNIGNRNDDAALRASAEQRGRTQADVDIRAADRREAARPPTGQQ